MFHMRNLNAERACRDVFTFHHFGAPRLPQNLGSGQKEELLPTGWGFACRLPEVSDAEGAARSLFVAHADQRSRGG